MMGEAASEIPTRSDCIGGAVCHPIDHVLPRDARGHDQSVGNVVHLSLASVSDPNRSVIRGKRKGQWPSVARFILFVYDGVLTVMMMMSRFILDLDPKWKVQT